MYKAKAKIGIEKKKSFSISLQGTNTGIFSSGAVKQNNPRV
jgi:hypothetical protein